MCEGLEPSLSAIKQAASTADTPSVQLRQIESRVDRRLGQQLKEQVRDQACQNINSWRTTTGVLRLGGP